MLEHLSLEGGHLKSRLRCCLAHYITSPALVGSVYKVMGQLASDNKKKGGKNTFYITASLDE